MQVIPQVHPPLQRKEPHSRYLGLAILLVPLAVAWAWGAFLPEGVYTTFAYARNLAAGRTLAYGLTLHGPDASLRAPLYVLVLGLLDWLGVPVLEGSVALSALGWGAAALGIYAAGREVGWPTAAIAALLVGFSPAVLSTSGTEATWALGLSWIAILLALRKRWRASCVASVLMLWTHLSWVTVAWAAGLLVWQGVERRRCPLGAGLTVAIAALAWFLGTGWLLGSPPTLAVPGLGGARYLGQLFDEGVLYWLIVPPAVVGLATLRGRAAWIALGSGLPALLGGGPPAEAASAVIMLLLAELGIARAARWLATQDLPWPERLSRPATRHTCLAVIPLLLLALGQASLLWQQYQARPTARQALERAAGQWLSSHGDPRATILASPRVAYLSARPALLWDGRAHDQAAMSSLVATLDADPPQYCVSSAAVAWTWLIDSGWFATRYQLVECFTTAYDSLSPLTVWGYRRSGFDDGETQAVDVPLRDGVRLVGHRAWPERISPGDAVYVTLFFQATSPVREPFQTKVRVFSPIDNANWAYRNQMTPDGLPVEWWRAGQVIAERFVLTTTEETPVGAYPLDLSVSGSEVEGLVLGYVAVPWLGELEEIEPVGARFADQIALLGFEAPDTWEAGSEVAVALYWEAARRPDENYVAFVQLIGPEGQLAAGHDGEPMDRRYPTRAWIPGEVVPDTHRLSLTADAPPGTYVLKAGLYGWPSLVRLPAWDASGIEQADRAITLRSVEVR